MLTVKVGRRDPGGPKGLTSSERRRSKASIPSFNVLVKEMRSLDELNVELYPRSKTGRRHWPQAAGKMGGIDPARLFHVMASIQRDGMALSCGWEELRGFHDY
jgi:hypothetical protein